MQCAEVDAVRARRTLHDDVRRFAEQLRAEHDEQHAADHEEQHDHEAQPLRAEESPSRRTVSPNRSLFSAGMPMPPPGPKAARRAWRAGGGEELLVVVEVGLGDVAARQRARAHTGVVAAVAVAVPLPPMFSRPLMPRPPGRAANRRSRRRSDTSRSARRACRAPMISPSSSTRIWSASAMVDTRCADDQQPPTRRCAVSSAARSRASVPRSSAENESSNT